MYKSPIQYCIAVLCAAAIAEPISAAVDFERDVAPILQRSCIRCHGGDKTRARLSLVSRDSTLRGGEHGDVLVPGHAGQSKLIEVVSGDSPKMPKQGDPLTGAQIQILRDWIDGGAAWPRDLTLKQAASADASWWSLQPIRSVEPPATIADEWCRTPIDAFVLARLRGKGLTPSPEADRRTLIRRVSFDLIGLPPTPEQTEAFVADNASDAYERMVDRFLAMPAYGERWARHWLDVARYGESHGFERNAPRYDAWHYRDWVIRAFNDDMPYDKFARMQIAGDLIEKGYEGHAAVGFLVAGVHNTTVGSSPRMKRLAREDELEEIVGTTSQTMLGLTAQCARCHDHKFDPITSRDYYEFAAAIAGVGFGDHYVLRKSSEAELAVVEKRLEVINTRVTELEAAPRATVLEARRDGNAQTPKPPKAVARWEFDGDLTDSVGSLDAIPVAGARVENGALVLNGEGYAKTQPLDFALTEKTLEAWVQLDTLDQGGGSTITVQTLNGSVFDGVVYAEREPARWMAGSNGFARSRSFNGPAETQAANKAVHMAIVYSADGTIAAYRNGIVYGNAYRPGGVQRYEARGSQILFGLRHGSPGGNRMLRGRVLRAALYDRALSGAEVAASAGGNVNAVSKDEIVALLDEPDRAIYRDLLGEKASLLRKKHEHQRSERVNMHTVAPNAKPGVTRVLNRGNIEDEGSVVSPSGIDAIATVSADWGLKPNASDADRRRQLADWVTDRDNALFHRVIVNRLWHYHFGKGIVDSPNDLGYAGGRPSHPDLLDWLATRFKAEGYSIKSMHRIILRSAAYRQASYPRPAAMKVDAGNSLLWRKSPQRMEAEVLRDTLLFVSGKLNRKMGGPPYVDVRAVHNNGTTYYFPFDRDDPAIDRRSIYRFSPRGGRNALFDVFDCPDPSTTAPKRATTTTPLQALSLMNNPFVLRMAEAIAKRVEAEAQASTDQVQQIYLLTLGRAPSDAETTLALGFVRAHGLAALARTMFNTNEFVMIE